MINQIISGINKIFYTIDDPNNDGFTQFRYKQYLYEIKWYVDEKLKSCSNFYGEEEWLEEKEKERMWSKLKK